MLPAATSGFPVPASASPYASMMGSSAAATASIPPDGSRSCLCARWMTPSESAAASLSPSRSSRLPRRTFAPSADTAAAAVSDRARPATSCPAAMSSGMMCEPEWPVPPVTNTRMYFLLVSDGAEEMVVWGPPPAEGASEPGGECARPRMSTPREAGTSVDSARDDAAAKPQEPCLGHADDEGASLQRDYVGRSEVSPQGRNLGVFVEGHHVDNVYTLAGRDDLHVNGCFSAGHVQRD